MALGSNTEGIWFANGASQMPHSLFVSLNGGKPAEGAAAAGGTEARTTVRITSATRRDSRKDTIARQEVPPTICGHTVYF